MISRKEQLNNNPFLELHNLSIFYDFKFDPIKAYLQHTQNLIQEVELDVKDKIKKWDESKGSNPEIPDGFDFYEHEVITTGEFRSLLNNSMFLTIYSFFENEFVALCEYAGSIQGSSLKPKDLSDNSYISQCRKFVTKVLKVDLSNLEKEWEEITNFQILRNSFAHNNGILKNNNSNIIGFMRKIDGLEIDEIALKVKIKDHQFLILLIDKLVKFLNSIIEKIIDQKTD